MAEITTNYFFKQGENNDFPILMLHGTGGTERDLVPIARFLNPQATLLGIRGRLVIDGQTRYFEQAATGEINLASLSLETDLLLEQINLIAQDKKIDVSNLTVIGYSNGANVAVYSMLEKAVSFKKAILFHPTVRQKMGRTGSLAGDKIWLSYGKTDPLVTQDGFATLIKEISAAKIAYTIFEHQQAHNINRAEMIAAKEWYRDNVLN